MAGYTQREVRDLRTDLADKNSKWDEQDLIRLLDRAREKFPTGTVQQLIDIACALGLGELLGSAALFNDWVVAEEQQKKSDIWRQLSGTLDRKLALAHVRAALNIEGGVSGRIVTRKLGYSRTARNRDEFSRPGH